MNKRALITGAGSGLGLALAKQFAAAGHAIAVADLDPGRAQAAVETLGGAAAGHFAVSVDVGDDASVAAMVQAVNQRWPDGFDVLINNAGVATAGSVAESSLEDWHWVMNINLMGVVRGLRAFVPMFKRRKTGLILSTASFAGLAGAPNIASYGTSKAAVVALSEMLRAELADHGVKVGVICPSFFKTNLLDNARGNDRFKAVAGHLMETARETADDIARYVFEAASRGQFLIIPTGPERTRWRVKRWFPEYYFKQLMKFTRAMRAH
ncbi:MAG: SDR family NAD(P)-dependent oxidoreductase [Ahniella sp.]|nr:SDR family NAD(P)-dependent oxidoreductase [Ahniella sp.]